jgi:ankyrin repeat protein
MEVLHIMIAHGADIKAVDKMGETLLMRSIKIGSEAVAEMIRYGADVHTKTRRGWTALHAATDAHFYQQQPESIALLLQAGAACDVKENRGYTPLHVAAANLDIGAAQLLLEAGADINARSYRRETPLALVDAGKNPFDAEMEVDDMEEEDYENMAAFLREHGAIPTPGNVKRKERPADDEE